MKKRLHIFVILLFTFVFTIPALADLEDRAFGTHNVGKVGYFTTNIGQFYPYGGQFEKTLEYPINSGHICMYRQCLMIGQPVNVISAADGRYEEFDAIGGFDAGNAEIAMSDNPETWPESGWPVKDNDGNPVFLSQQDSYCAYSDSTNWRYANNGESDKLMNIRVYQTIYSWGLPTADKFVILKFEIENRNSFVLDSMYFNFYSDLDIGGQGNEYNEWADDCINFDKSRETLYFYDSDNYSNEWNEDYPFLSGITFLKTPNNLGITDWHWIDVMIDEVAVNSAYWDSVSWYLMKSDTSFFHRNPLLNVDDYFHLGDNPINGTHFDDPATTRITDANGKLIGGAMVAYICNGPFSIQPGEKAEIWIGCTVGDNETDLLEVTDNLLAHYADGFNSLIPPPAPELIVNVADQQVHLSWSNEIDITYLNESLNPPANDLEGYILYRTTDPTLRSWDVLDTISMIYKNDPAVIEDKYEFTDQNVNNGFNYYYNLTTYKVVDGNLIESLKLADINNILNQPSAQQAKPQTLPAENKADLDKIKVVPNPYVVSAPWDKSRLGNTVFGEPIRNIAFTNLPSPCTIRIFTIDGDLVQTIEHTGDYGREEWNLLTSERRPIVSGMYFFHVESKIGDKIGRFSVIR
ncbi:MAG: hypothetical protein DRQ06_04310 [Candidatus Hydrothermota bacterium]|nr:MAG: hypothetical protein DRQ06_04310 [Candidatus Hydrothermae bacterium]